VPSLHLVPPERFAERALYSLVIAPEWRLHDADMGARGRTDESMHLT
jgi:hypothetical protein